MCGLKKMCILYLRWAGLQRKEEKKGSWHADTWN